MKLAEIGWQVAVPGRVNEGPFGQWINTYYVWCDDLTAK